MLQIESEVTMEEQRKIDSISEAIIDIKDPLVWTARILKFGVSMNGNNWTSEACSEAVALGKFENVPCIARDAEGHIWDEKKDPNLVCGWFSNARIEDESVVADLKVVEGSAPWIEVVRSAWKDGNKGLIGLSIVAVAESDEGTITKIHRVVSVDPVLEPAAGGLLLMVEAVKEIDETLTPEQNKQPDNITESNDSETQTEGKVIMDNTLLIKVVSMVSESALPGEIKNIVRDDYVAKLNREETVTEAEVEAKIKSIVDSLAEAAKPKETEVVVKKDRMDNISEGIKGFLDGKVGTLYGLHQSVNPGGNFAKDTVTPGHSYGTMAEALTTASWTSMLSTSINLKAQELYESAKNLDNWRRFASVGSFETMNQQTRGQFTSMAIGATVAEGGPYTDLSGPSDFGATFTPVKLGGARYVTLEMVLNDHVGALRMLPQYLADSVRVPLAKNAMNLLLNNSTWTGDSTPVYTSAHSNTHAVALSEEALTSGIVAMYNQSGIFNNEAMCISPSYLIVAPVLHKTAYELVVPAKYSTSTVYEAEQGITVLSEPFQDDTDMWILVTNSTQPCMEVSFLNGVENPEIFVANNPLEGYAFTNDQIVYKTRLICGYTVLDYRYTYAGIPG